MSRAEDNYHLGVKALIRNDVGNILLLKVNTEKLTNTKESYWDIPGGRVERGSTIEETLRREVEEETSISTLKNIQKLDMVMSNIRIPVGDSDVGLILAIYTAEANPQEAIILSDEHSDLDWFEPEKTAKLLGVKYPVEFTEKITNL